MSIWKKLLMNILFKNDSEIVDDLETKSCKDLFAGILYQAIEDLRIGKAPVHNNPRVVGHMINDRRLAKAWILNKMPEAQIKLDDCLSVLDLSKSKFLEYLKRKELL